jgi:hypothetical protein
VHRPFGISLVCVRLNKISFFNMVVRLFLAVCRSGARSALQGRLEQIASLLLRITLPGAVAASGPCQGYPPLPLPPSIIIYTPLPFACAVEPGHVQGRGSLEVSSMTGMRSAAVSLAQLLRSVQPGGFGYAVLQGLRHLSTELHYAPPGSFGPRHMSTGLGFDSAPAGQSLRDKVFLVTGATSGIGRVTAEALAQQQATVLVHGRWVGGSSAAADAVCTAEWLHVLEQASAPCGARPNYRWKRMACCRRCHHSRHAVLLCSAVTLPPGAPQKKIARTANPARDPCVDVKRESLWLHVSPAGSTA